MKLRREVGDPSKAAAPGHEDGLDLVELTRVAFIAEAVAIRQELDRIGVESVVFQSDAGGWAPHFGVEQGQRVMVHARDLDRAQVVLSVDGGLVPTEVSEPPRPVVKHLRHHEGG